MWPNRAFHDENRLLHSVHGGMMPVVVVIVSGFLRLGLRTLKAMVVGVVGGVGLRSVLGLAPVVESEVVMDLLPLPLPLT